MAVSTRTAVGVHALTFLAQWEAHGLQSSDRIADSLESNASLVRRVLGRLRERGLVSAVEGSGGGWHLARSPEEITLLDVLTAVEDEPTMLPTHAHPPSRSCVIGRHMQQLLESEFTTAQHALESQLGRTTISDLLHQVHLREPGSARQSP